MSSLTGLTRCPTSGIILAATLLPWTYSTLPIPTSIPLSTVIRSSTPPLTVLPTTLPLQQRNHPRKVKTRKAAGSDGISSGLLLNPNPICVGLLNMFATWVWSWIEYHTSGNHPLWYLCILGTSQLLHSIEWRPWNSWSFSECDHWWAHPWTHYMPASHGNGWFYHLSPPSSSLSSVEARENHENHVLQLLCDNLVLWYSSYLNIIRSALLRDKLELTIAS